MMKALVLHQFNFYMYYRIVNILDLWQNDFFFNYYKFINITPYLKNDPNIF